MKKTATKTKILPLGNRLLVRRDTVKTTTTGGGIHLPEVTQDKERPRTATVVAVGPGLLTEDGKRIPIDLKPGDRVIISKHAGNEVRDPDDWYGVLAIIAEDEVQCRIDEAMV